MSERLPSQGQELAPERGQIQENVRMILVSLAEKAYLIFDQQLRNTSPALATFDPTGTQHIGNMEPKLQGLRPSYSKDWGGGFGFHASVISHQRRETAKWIKENENFLELIDRIDQFILTPESGLVSADFPSPEMNAVVDFLGYQIKINQTNTHVANAANQVRRMLGEKNQNPTDPWDEEKFYKRILEENREMPVITQIIKVIQGIRNLNKNALSNLNKPASDELFQGVLQDIIQEIREQDLKK